MEEVDKLSTAYIYFLKEDLSQEKIIFGSWSDDDGCKKVERFINKIKNAENISDFDTLINYLRSHNDVDCKSYMLVSSPWFDFYDLVKTTTSREGVPLIYEGNFNRIFRCSNVYDRLWLQIDDQLKYGLFKKKF